MTESSVHLHLLVIAIGGLVVLALLIKALFVRLRLPALMGYLLIGVLVGTMDQQVGFMPERAHSVFELLSKIGIIALLFTVGLKSDLHKLLGHFKGASLIWIGNVLVSGLTGFAVAFWLGVDMVSSMIVGIALTATSIGVPADIWASNDAIETDDGQLFVDTAELDDISGIIFVAVLFALLPALGERFGDAQARDTAQAAASAPLGWLFTKTIAFVLSKLVVLSAACYMFARYAEKPLIGFFERSESGTDTVISVVSIGIIIAGLAGIMGFSVAIGAFFAGLAFSRNRDTIETQTPYTTIQDFFVPFFFIGIGLQVDVTAIGQAWGLAGALLVTAFLGKLIGTLLPSLAITTPGCGLTLGLSMVPRAEITMIIIGGAHQMGDWAVDAQLFTAMFVVVFGTCLLTPPLLRSMINRHCT